MAMEQLVISLLDYNGADKTIACLRSLEKLTTDTFNFSIVIIDNYPQGKFSLGDEKFPTLEIEIIKNKEARGFSGGHNVAFQYALKKGADYVMVLNNDTIVDKDLAKELIRTAREDRNRGAIVPKIYFAKGHEFHKERYDEKDLGKVIWYAGGRMDWDNINGFHIGVDEVDRGQFDNAGKTRLLTGCCVLLPREVIERTGGFDERFFLYYEDADLNERIKRLGYTIWYEPKAVLWHLNAASTGGSGSVQQDYFISRNRLLFGMRYARFRTKIALIRESLRLLISGREWQKKGIRDFYMRRFGKGSFPV